jgi:hypothetical protein
MAKILLYIGVAIESLHSIDHVCAIIAESYRDPATSRWHGKYGSLFLLDYENVYHGNYDGLYHIVPHIYIIIYIIIYIYIIIVNKYQASAYISWQHLPQLGERHARPILISDVEAHFGRLCSRFDWSYVHGQSFFSKRRAKQLWQCECWSIFPIKVLSRRGLARSYLLETKSI